MACRHRALQAQRGQALILSLFLVALGALAWVQLHQSGQLVHEKSRLVHAADAAAYSGAVVQARSLNFLALANRAQVAHQVALAHLVTFEAWAMFGGHAAQRAAMGNPPVYLIAALFGPAHGAAYAAALAAGSDVVALQALGAAVQEHDRVAHEVLAGAQQAVLGALPETRRRAMQAVLQANFPGPGAAAEVVLDPQPLSDDLPGTLAAQWGAGADPLRDLALQAVGDHRFLAPRNHETRNAWVVSARCPGLRHVLRRRGETRLEPGDAWWAGDTLSYHALRSNRWVGCYYREYPVGWADAAAAAGIVPAPLEHVENPPRDFAAQDFWRWAQARTGWALLGGSGNPLANSWAVADQRRQTTRGFGRLVDFAGPRPDGLRFAVRVHRPLSALAVPGGAGQVRISERWLAPWRLPGGQVAVAAAAETYFVAAVAGERPSLFTPAWRARLVPVSAAERHDARLRQERT